jgi:hypothetical protein
MAQQEAAQAFPNTSSSTLPARPKDPPGLYILQARTDSLVPKETMTSWVTATKYLEELLQHDALRHKTWAANGILQMHLDGKVGRLMNDRCYRILNSSIFQAFSIEAVMRLFCTTVLHSSL